MQYFVVKQYFLHLINWKKIYIRGVIMKKVINSIYFYLMLILLSPILSELISQIGVSLWVIIFGSASYSSSLTTNITIAINMFFLSMIIIKKDHS